MMRPNKRTNPGAHQAGTASRGKGRYYTTDLPRDSENAPRPEIATHLGDEAYRNREGPPPKYVGRASVGGVFRDEQDLVVDLTEPREWVDPLDDDGFDLSSVTIDLRHKLLRDPPDSYYERYSSRVPGHE